MLLHLPAVLTTAEVNDVVSQLTAMNWVAGKHTAGGQAIQVKQNLQIDPADPAYLPLAQRIAEALLANPLCHSAALPHHLLTPMFNCYQEQGYYGDHIDGAIHRDRITGQQHRTDVSLTLFLSAPEDYEGGELIIEDAYGSHSVKLDAGDAILYPATSLHRVEPVTSGRRLAAFSWIQSLVRSDAERTLLFQLDMTILKLRQQLGDQPEVTQLTQHYHNLLRRWSEA